VEFSFETFKSSTLHPFYFFRIPRKFDQQFQGMKRFAAWKRGFGFRVEG
jgi:hypothetical protein